MARPKRSRDNRSTRDEEREEKPRRRVSDLGELTEFQRGYLAGYDDGLAKCGPLAGVTGFFERRRERQKIKSRYDQAALKAMREKIAELEGERASGRAALGNPGKTKPKVRRQTNPVTQSDIKKLLRRKDGPGGWEWIRGGSRDETIMFRYRDPDGRAMTYAYVLDRRKDHRNNSGFRYETEDGELWEDLRAAKLHALETEAMPQLQADGYWTDIESSISSNPSDVASAAIGGGLGGLALGPVGAAAGAAGGVLLKERAKKKRKSRKNPTSEAEKAKIRRKMGRL